LNSALSKINTSAFSVRMVSICISLPFFVKQTSYRQHILSYLNFIPSTLIISLIGLLTMFFCKVMIQMFGLLFAIFLFFILYLAFIFISFTVLGGIGSLNQYSCYCTWYGIYLYKYLSKHEWHANTYALSCYYLVKAISSS
jgi:hypothetical protein